MTQRWLPALAGVTVVGGGLWLVSCASAPTTKSLAADAAAAMGGLERLRGVQTVVMRDGTGTRLRLGQMVHATDPETAAGLSKVTETLDLVNGRAALDYEMKIHEMRAEWVEHQQHKFSEKKGWEETEADEHFDADVHNYFKRTTDGNGVATQGSGLLQPNKKSVSGSESGSDAITQEK